MKGKIMAVQHGNSKDFTLAIGFAWYQMMMEFSEKDVCIGCASKSILAAALDTLLDHENAADVMDFIHEQISERSVNTRTIQ